MKQKLSIACIVIIALSLAVIVCAYLGVFPGGTPGLTIVRAPEQTAAQRPGCFPDPTANDIPLPETANLGGSHAISTVAVMLNPSAIWEPRTQEIAVLVSTDGESFTEAAAAAKYDFDPATGNRIRIDFDSVKANYVKVVFTMNSSSRTGGAQTAEIAVYE